jgi:putative signal transducing protein
MVTLRTYWNGAEAALVKSVLDDHGIFCRLADENANLYGGAPFAMPIRLRVAEDEAEQASRILNAEEGEGVELDTAMAAASAPPEMQAPREVMKDNPWELLAIASLFFVPAICFLQQRYPVGAASGPRARVGIAAISVSHFLGSLAIGFALFLAAVYFYLRRSEKKRAAS